MCWRYGTYRSKIQHTFVNLRRRCRYGAHRNIMPIATKYSIHLLICVGVAGTEPVATQYSAMQAMRQAAHFSLRFRSDWYLPALQNHPFANSSPVMLGLSSRKARLPLCRTPQCLHWGCSQSMQRVLTFVFLCAMKPVVRSCRTPQKTHR